MKNSSLKNSIVRYICAVLNSSLLCACGGAESGSSAGVDRADNVTPAVDPVNLPIANAGIDQSVALGDVVELDGSTSSDPQLKSLSYAWALVTAPANSTARLSSTDHSQSSFIPDVDGTYIARLIVNNGEEDSAADTVTIKAGSVVSFYDDFSGSGALIGYVTNNAASLPNVGRVNNRYHADLVNNRDQRTVHFNKSQGRLDARLVSFPFVAIARNIGIGTQAYSQQAPASAGGPYIFAGLQVHVENLDSRNSSHVVVGHRGNAAPFTVEAKHTLDGKSKTTDAGANIVPAGRADIRIVGNSDRSLTVYWQLPNPDPAANPDNWILYRGTGEVPGVSPAYAEQVYVGLITYASGTAGIPFVGTCDSFEISF